MAQIAIIGPGAIGGVVAAWLLHTGRHQVTLCARRPLDGLRAETPGGPLAFRPPVLTAPAQAAPVDWVLACTKTYDAAGAAAWFPGLVAHHTRLAVLQNGVEHRERFGGLLPADRLVPVMVDIPSERAADGLVRQRGPGRLVAPDDDAGSDFVALFAGTPLDAAVTADFTSAVWRKLCANAAGVLNALLLQPAGVFRREAVAEAARAIVRECVAVGRAEGAVLGGDVPDQVIAGYRNAPADSVNSIQADRAAGRPMEIDARNGVIVRRGRLHGIPTPCNQLAVALLEALTAPYTTSSAL
jgi:2-dehydropantoate 2-reductase